MKKIITLLSLVLISKFSIGQQDAALAPPSGSFTSPVSGCSLTNAENVTVRIFNYGPGSITVPFTVSYTINGGAPVTEMVPATTIFQNTSYQYTFTTKADLSVPGTYTFDATVSVPGDPTPVNDTYTGYVVNALSPSIGGTITAPASVCITSNSGTLTLAGHTGNVLGWQSSTDGGGTWINISNTSTSQSYTNLTVATKYRVQVQNGACTPVYSAISTVTIDPVSVGGTISTSATVCRSGNSGTLTSGGGRVGTILKWQYSLNGGTTWNDTAVTTTTLSYLNLTATRMYRVQVASGSCNPVFSSTATITVSPLSVAGTINPAAITVCSGSNSGSLTLSGHTGSILNWQSSINGGTTWTNIANTTVTQAYTNVSVTTMYRNTIQSGACPSVFSSTATITVASATIAGSVTPNATECSGSNAGTLTLAGYTGTIQYWESSINGGTTYTTIANTTDTQPYTNLTATTIYRANVKNGSCTAANSGAATVTIVPASVGGITAPKTQVCSGVNSGNITLSGNTGTIQNWESSTNGVTWTPIVNTTATQAYTNLTTTTYYRAKVKSGICSIATSSIDTITVDAPTVGGTISSSGSVCYGNNSGVLTLSGNTGSVVRWEFSVDNGITYNQVANTALTYSFINITTTTLYRAVVKNNTCSTANSSIATLTVNPLSVGGTVSGSTTVCSGSNTGVLTISGKTGAVQRWESSTNAGVTWNNIANTTTSQSYTNVLSTTYYRALVKSGSCSNDTSSIAIITVDPVSVGGILSSTDTVCKGSNSGTLTLSGQTGTVQHWEFSTDGGTTWLILGNISTSQSYVNLTTTTSYRVFVKNGSCNGTTSSVATIKVDNPIDGGTLSGNASLCDTINSGTITLSGSSGTIYNWESSINAGVTWLPVANTTTTLNYTNLKTTTWYRAIVGNVGCGRDTSTVAKINISLKTDAGTLSMSDTVCFGSNSGTLRLMGYVGTILGWEQSLNGGTSWTAVPVANITDSLKYSNITASISYRVMVQSGVCVKDTSTVATLTVTGIVNGGTIAPISVCDTINSGTLTLSGAVGTVKYWQSSANGGVSWDSIANTTLTQNFTNLKDTTLFRAVVATTRCGKDTSAVGIVYVNPKAVPGIVSANATVCAGTNSGTLHLTGYQGIIQNWESSVNGGTTWIPIVNTTDSLVYTNLNVTTAYHVKVKSGNCNADTSTRAIITVNPLANGGTIAPVSVCDTINSGSLTLTGSVGTVNNWEMSENGGITWAAIPNATTTLSYVNVKDTTLFRAILTTVCGKDTSAVGTLFVNPGTLAGTLTGADSVCFGINTGTLHLTAYRGTILQWQKSTDGGTVWSAIATTTDSLTYTNLLISTLYRAVVQNGSCDPDTSASVLINVKPTSVGGTVTVVSSGVCGGANNGVLTLAGNVGVVKNWESSIDGSVTWTPIANATTVLTYTNIAQTTAYRAVVQSGPCSNAFSNTIVITLSPKPSAAFTADTVCQGIATTFKNNSTILSGFIPYTEWDFKDGGTSLSFTPTHLYATAGTYDVSLHVTSNQGCIDTAIVKVVVKALPLSTIVSNKGKFGFCTGDSLKLIAEAGPYNYLWNSTFTTKEITVKTPGNYRLVVTDQVTACTSSDSVTVQLFAVPLLDAGIDTSLSLGNYITLNPSSSNVISSWTWFPGTGLSNSMVKNPIAMPVVTTTYNLVVIDVNGCMAVDSVVITVLNDFNVIISNMMTPNGDGFNDTWIIQNIENYPRTKVTVVTRQGQEVYRSDSYNNKWDGTQDGNKLADGTYYYVVQFEGATKVYKGAITILGQDK
jgi:gliding motility-associated-like protein